MVTPKKVVIVYETELPSDQLHDMLIGMRVQPTGWSLGLSVNYHEREDEYSIGHSGHCNGSGGLARIVESQVLVSPQMAHVVESGLSLLRASFRKTSVQLTPAKLRRLTKPVDASKVKGKRVIFE